MEEYTPNSHKYREAQKKKANSEKKIEKVKKTIPGFGWYSSGAGVGDWPCDRICFFEI